MKKAIFILLCCGLQLTQAQSFIDSLGFNKQFSDPYYFSTCVSNNMDLALDTIGAGTFLYKYEVFKYNGSTLGSTPVLSSQSANNNYLNSPLVPGPVITGLNNYLDTAEGKFELRFTFMQNGNVVDTEFYDIVVEEAADTIMMGMTTLATPAFNIPPNVTLSRSFPGPLINPYLPLLKFEQLEGSFRSVKMQLLELDSNENIIDTIGNLFDTVNVNPAGQPQQFQVSMNGSIFLDDTLDQFFNKTGRRYYSLQVWHGDSSCLEDAGKYYFEVVSSDMLSHKDEALDELSLYPNPAKNLLYIVNIESICTYQIYSNSGQLIDVGALKKGDNKISLNLLAGLYILRVEGYNLHRLQIE